VAQQSSSINPCQTHTTFRPFSFLFLWRVLFFALFWPTGWVCSSTWWFFIQFFCLFPIPTHPNHVGISWSAWKLHSCPPYLFLTQIWFFSSKNFWTRTCSYSHFFTCDKRSAMVLIFYSVFFFPLCSFLFFPPSMFTYNCHAAVEVVEFLSTVNQILLKKTTLDPPARHLQCAPWFLLLFVFFLPLTLMAVNLQQKLFCEQICCSYSHVFFLSPPEGRSTFPSKNRFPVVFARGVFASGLLIWPKHWVSFQSHLPPTFAVSRHPLLPHRHFRISGFQLSCGMGPCGFLALFLFGSLVFFPNPLVMLTVLLLHPSFPPPPNNYGFVSRPKLFLGFR